MNAVAENPPQDCQSEPRDSSPIRELGRSMISEKDTAIFLCDITGKMAQPWIEAGYHCILVDPQHPAGIHTDGFVTRIGDIIVGCTDYLGKLIRTGRVCFVMASRHAPTWPCLV